MAYRLFIIARCLSVPVRFVVREALSSAEVASPYFVFVRDYKGLDNNLLYATLRLLGRFEVPTSSS